MSFYTALTGLSGSQKEIATVSHNIANVGTNSFKRSRAEFTDLVSASPFQKSASKIGSGTILNTIRQQFSQGNIKSSVSDLDIAISGQGFFALQRGSDSDEVAYSRRGAFTVNSDRYVVNSSGQSLMGYPVHEDGSVISKDFKSTIPLRLPIVSGDPKATENISLRLNMHASDKVISAQSQYTKDIPWVFNRNDSSTYNHATSVTIYDSSGNPQVANIYFVKGDGAGIESGMGGKWRTYVFVGDTELIAQPTTYKDKNDGKTSYMNRFGQIVTNPVSLDPTFDKNASHPLYRADEQIKMKLSVAARAVGQSLSMSGLSFGAAGTNKVKIVTDPKEYNKTFEATNNDKVKTYWGKNFFSISVNNSIPLSIDIRAGDYTELELAAEMKRAANSSFGDSKYIHVSDTFVDTDSSLHSGNDVILIDFFKNSSEGGNIGLKDSNNSKNPIVIDLLGNAGKSGTKRNVEGIPSPEASIEMKREDLIEVAQKRMNYAFNERFQDFGKSSADWVNESDPPIVVGFDVTKQTLTFKVNKAQIGPNAAEFKSRFTAMKVYGQTSEDNTLGISGENNSALIDLSKIQTWNSKQVIPRGDYVLDSTNQRYGIDITYNPEAKTFEFISGTTGEQSKIRIGRSVLAQKSDIQAQVNSYDFSAVELDANGTVSLSEFGTYFEDYTFTNTTGSKLSDNALVSAIIVDYKNWSVDKASIGSSVVTEGSASKDSTSGVAEVQSFDLSSLKMQEGETYELTAGNIKLSYIPEIDGLSLEKMFSAFKESDNYDEAVFSLTKTGSVFTVTWKALVDQNPAVFSQSKNIYMSTDETATDKLLITGPNSGGEINVGLRINGKLQAMEQVGDSESLTKKGVRIGDSLSIFSDESSFFKNDNDLLKIGEGKYNEFVVTNSGSGLKSTSAKATGQHAPIAMSKSFSLNITKEENKIIAAVGGVSGTIILPDKVYTGESLAIEIQNRINLIEDVTTGVMVSGVRVSFNADENRLDFVIGTAGSESQINIIGSDRLGLKNVTNTQGTVPEIRELKQATNKNGELLYIDSKGSITTAETVVLQKWFPLYVEEGEMIFDANGKITNSSDPFHYLVDDNSTDKVNSFFIQYDDKTQESSQAFIIKSSSQDGYSAGTLEGIEIGSGGNVVASYSNNITKSLAKIALINFANPNGLTQVGNSSYIATIESGFAYYGEAGSNGFGTLQSAALERSNVDLTEELVNLIAAQRNFQASAKAIEITTTLAQTIINIRG